METAVNLCIIHYPSHRTHTGTHTNTHNARATKQKKPYLPKRLQILFCLTAICRVYNINIHRVSTKTMFATRINVHRLSKRTICRIYSYKLVSTCLFYPATIFYILQKKKEKNVITQIEGAKNVEGFLHSSAHLST